MFYGKFLRGSCCVVSGLTLVSMIQSAGVLSVNALSEGKGVLKKQIKVTRYNRKF